MDLHSENTIPQLKQEIHFLKAKLAEAETLAKDKEILETEFKRSKKRFETIFDQSSLGNKIIDSGLTIIKVNKALTEILQYSENELLGKNILDLSALEFKEDWEILRNELWKNERQSFSIDACIVRKDKTLLWCHVISIVFEDDGRTLGYTIIEDISERKRRELLEKELQDRELLVKQQQDIFKNTLDVQEKERARIAEGIHNSLGQLLFATKIQLGQIYFKNSAENTSNISVLEKAEELLSSCIKESRQISHQLMPAILHDFGLEAAIEGMCQDMSDKTAFTCIIKLRPAKKDRYFETVVFRLVQELMLNISKHSGATKGKISIVENGKEVIITVEDNGKGFNVEEYKGSGIGLSTIRNNISLLKGTIQFHSLPKNGTIITIHLPK